MFPRVHYPLIVANSYIGSVYGSTIALQLSTIAPQLSTIAPQFSTIALRLNSHRMRHRTDNACKAPRLVACSTGHQECYLCHSRDVNLPRVQVMN